MSLTIQLLYTCLTSAGKLSKYHIYKFMKVVEHIIVCVQGQRRITKILLNWLSANPNLHFYGTLCHWLIKNNVAGSIFLFVMYFTLIKLPSCICESCLCSEIKLSSYPNSLRTYFFFLCSLHFQKRQNVYFLHNMVLMQSNSLCWG